MWSVISMMWGFSFVNFHLFDKYGILISTKDTAKTPAIKSRKYMFRFCNFVNQWGILCLFKKYGSKHENHLYKYLGLSESKLLKPHMHRLKTIWYSLLCKASENDFSIYKSSYQWYKNITIICTTIVLLFLIYFAYAIVFRFIMYFSCCCCAHSFNHWRK